MIFAYAYIKNKIKYLNTKKKRKDILILKKKYMKNEKCSDIYDKCTFIPYTYILNTKK